MKFDPVTTSSTMADEFDRQLRATLSPADYAEAINRNRDEALPFVCHTHDFLDANVLMAAAFEAAVGRPVKAANDVDAWLWSRAWETWRNRTLAPPVDASHVEYERLFDAVAAELAGRHPGARVSSEHTGGGIMCVYLYSLQTPGDLFVLGTSADTWAADFYETEQRYEDGDPCGLGLTTDLSSDSVDVTAIADAVDCALATFDPRARQCFDCDTAYKVDESDASDGERDRFCSDTCARHFAAGVASRGVDYLRGRKD